MHDEFGYRGDLFFNILEPIMTKTPVFIIPGNTDMVDLGRLLLHRFRFLENNKLM